MLIYTGREETPNDPKLSDGGAWRGSCEGGAKKEHTSYGKRWLGRDGSKLEIAATVTRGAVRCSAWLGDVGNVDSKGCRKFGFEFGAQVIEGCIYVE